MLAQVVHGHAKISCLSRRIYQAWSAEEGHLERTVEERYGGGWRGSGGGRDIENGVRYRAGRGVDEKCCYLFIAKLSACRLR